MQLLPGGSFDHNSAAETADVEGGIRSHKKRTFDLNVSDINLTETSGLHGDRVSAGKQRFQAVTAGGVRLSAAQVFAELRAGRFDCRVRNCRSAFVDYSTNDSARAGLRMRGSQQDNQREHDSSDTYTELPH